MQTFCTELFHEEHLLMKGQAVIIQNFDPSSNMLTILNLYESKLTYLAGSVLDKDKLRRGETGKAEACILLANKNSKQALEQDFRNILQALSIKRFVYDANKGGKDDEHHNMKIVMQLIKPESKMLYKKSLNLDSIHDQLIVVEEIKMNLLAKSCFAPGLIAMISNLVSSMSEPEEEFDDAWLNEYVEGTGFEIYRVKIEEIDFTSKLPFWKVASIAH